jgi:hypothetical protein
VTESKAVDSRVALAREHPGRVLVVALEPEDAGGERVDPRQVLVAEEPHQLAVVLEPGERHASDLAAGQGLPDQCRVDLLVPHVHDLLVAGVRRHHVRPLRQLARRVLIEVFRRPRCQRAHIVGRACRDLRSVQVRGNHRESLESPSLRNELLGARVVVADALADLGEVADPLAGDDLLDPGGVANVDAGQRALVERQARLA